MLGGLVKVRAIQLNVADPEMWRRATAMLTDVLDRSGLASEAVAKEAAFCGR